MPEVEGAGEGAVGAGAVALAAVLFAALSEARTAAQSVGRRRSERGGVGGLRGVVLLLGR
jgi:hypothetical protein